MTERLNTALIPEGIKAVVLDWDDTVVDTIDAKIRQHIYVAKKHFGIDLERDAMVSDWGKPLYELIQKWYQIPEEGSEDEYSEVLKTVLSYSGDFPKRPIDGAIETIAAFRDSGRRIGVVTGSLRADLCHDFELTSLSPEYFDYFQTSDDSTYHKPDPNVFEPTNIWLNSQSIPPNQVLYIGDSLRDGVPALANGYRFVGVETGHIDMPGFYREGMLSIRALGDLLRRTRV